jgi:uncharacterized membrane protein
MAYQFIDTIVSGQSPILTSDWLFYTDSALILCCAQLLVVIKLVFVLFYPDSVYLLFDNRFLCKSRGLCSCILILYLVTYVKVM